MSLPQVLRSSTQNSTFLPSAYRAALAGVPILLLGSSALAAQQAAEIHRAPSATKYGGIYHAHTGTWTRRANQLGPAAADVIYSNTAQAGYFSTAGGTGGFAPGSENFDEGGLPGTTNATPFAIGANRDTYRVNGYEISYCDFGAPMSGGWEISFYESYTPCTFDNNPVTRIVSTGLPAGGLCWTLNIDLTGGMEFDIAADGGNGWDDDPDLDSFGWSFRYAGTDPAGGPGGAGFQLAGDPTSTDPGGPGTGTYYGGPGLCGGSTGYLTQDFWWLEDASGSSSGCFFFGGYSNSNGCDTTFSPFASWHMEILAESGGLPAIGVDFCSSNANSTGVMTTLTASGSDVAAGDDVLLLASNMPIGTLGFFITSQTQGNVTNPGGSAGNLCVIGDLGRFMQPGQVKISGSDGTLALSTGLGEWSTSGVPQATPPLSYAAMAGMTSNFQLWHRDSAMGSSTSNFSNGLSITWQ